MVTRLLFLALGMFSLLGIAYAQVPVFINEIHYDNNGTDVAEGVEIAGPAGTNLACFRIYLYNGSVPGAAVVYDSIVLSGIIPNLCNGYGVVNFPVNSPAQIQNGPTDGLALVFRPTYPGCATPGIPTVAQFLSYEGTITASNGPAIGMTSTDIGVFESSTSPVGNSLQLTGSGVLYSDFSWVPTAVNTAGALNNNQTFGGSSCGTGPVVGSELRFRTTPTGCITPGSPFSIQVCATNAAGYTDISFNGSITLSVISGPGVLGGTTTLNALFGCATFSGLTLSAAGNYTLQATNGVWFDTSSVVYVVPACTACPNLNAVLVDACGVQEGRNEILFFNSGSYSIPVNPSAFSINYGASTPPTTGYTNVITSNQNYINALNTMAGCNIFHDALSSSPIPPNTNFLVMSYTPLTTYNFAAWCTLGDVYVIFSQDPDWDTTSGNFKNCLDCAPLGDGTTPRYFRTNFSGLNGGTGCDFTYNYTPCSDLLCNGNGDGIDFGYGGGTPTANWTECTPQGVLPVAYTVPLKGTRLEEGVRLDWETAFETGSQHFELERALNGNGPFAPITQLLAAGQTSDPTAYHWLDRTAPNSQVFYRLRQVDANGTSNLSHIAIVPALASEAEVLISHIGRNYSFLVHGQGPVHLELFDAAGRRLRAVDAQPGAIMLQLSDLACGIYFYRAAIDGQPIGGRFVIAD